MRWSVASLSPLLDCKLHEGRDPVPPSITVHTLRFHTEPGLLQKISKRSSRDLRRRLYSVEDTAWRSLKWRVRLLKAGWCRRAWRDRAQPLSGEPSAPLPQAASEGTWLGPQFPLQEASRRVLGDPHTSPAQTVCQGSGTISRWNASQSLRTESVNQRFIFTHKFLFLFVYGKPL